MQRMKTLDNLVLQAQKQKRDQIEATKLRKERRNALREAFSLKKLTNTLLTQVIQTATK